MIGQVKTIQGVKTVVPLSNETATDSVALGNMETVTSNAVAEMFSKPLDNTKFEFSATEGSAVTAQCTGICYITFAQQNGSATYIWEDGVNLLANDNYTPNVAWWRCFTILIRKGHQYSWTGPNGSIQNQKFLPLNIQ